MHRHRCDWDRGRRPRPDWPFGEFFGGSARRRGWGGRMFDQGDLRYVILQLLVDRPRHGYDIIKALEEKSGGAYAPSAGAVYPTLTLLEEMGYAVSTTEDGGKKVYTITDSGRAFLAENQSTVDDVFERIGDLGAAVFSDTMREVGRVFGHMAKATFESAREQRAHGSDSTREILDVLRRAADEIDVIMGRRPRTSSAPGSGGEQTGGTSAP